VGGTNSRLGLFQADGERVELLHEQRYTNAGRSGLGEIVAEFDRSHGVRPGSACFGIAGPVVDGRVEATNLPWVIDAAELSEELGTPHVWLLNDLEANAHGIATLGPSDLHMLRGFAPGLTGNAAVISPGTGLGEAGLFWDGSRHHPFACEGGHCDLAPADEQQIGLLRHLIGKYGHASWERVLSGPGFVELYDYLKDVARIAVATEASFAPPGADRAATIARAGLAEACPVASAALDWFVTLLGAEAGNLALKLNATAGVFLGGGIPPKILPRLRGPRFVEAFLAKGRMRRVLEPVPVAVVLDDTTALKGSARYAALQAATAVEERA
jgi:glucokinase